MNSYTKQALKKICWTGNRNSEKWHYKGDFDRSGNNINISKNCIVSSRRHSWRGHDCHLGCGTCTNIALFVFLCEWAYSFSMRLACHILLYTAVIGLHFFWTDTSRYLCALQDVNYSCNVRRLQ